MLVDMLDNYDCYGCVIGKGFYDYVDGSKMIWFGLLKWCKDDVEIFDSDI